jgi:hypothetical protein
MDLTYEDLEDGIRRIKLAGRMDVEGSREIDLKFTSLTASRQAFVIVDLSLVDFLSSIGLGDSRPQRQGTDVAAREGHPALSPASCRESPRDDAGGPSPSGRLRFRGSAARGPAG